MTVNVTSIYAPEPIAELQKAMPTPKCSDKDGEVAIDQLGLEQTSPPRKDTEPSLLKFPDTTNNYARGMVRTPKTQFFDQLDLGVPMDPAKAGDSDVLILYNREKALPDDYYDTSLLSKAVQNDDDRNSESSSSIPSIGTKDALKNCDYVNVVLSYHEGRANYCTAIVPQYESYHIQKWMRLGDGKEKKGVDPSAELQLVSRGMQSNGKNQFEPPVDRNRREAWGMLTTYYSSFADATAVLKPLVKKVATRKKTVTVMVSNFGQSELLVNFVCAARSRNMDISSILVFATDMETKELAESLGLTAFYDKWVSVRRNSHCNTVFHDFIALL